MKKAAKVFLILGIIIGFPTIIAPIIGFTTLNRLKYPRNTNDIRIWAILSIAFVSVLGGIFTLLIKEEELYDDFNPTNCSQFESAKINLIELKQLRDRGEIDEQTYIDKRKKYVEVL